MAYSSSISPFYPSYTSPFYPSYDSPFYSSHNTNTPPSCHTSYFSSPNSFSLYPSQQLPSYSTDIPISTPSPNHFYHIESSTPNLSLSQNYSPPSAGYYNGYENTEYSSHYDSINYPVFDGKDDAYGWILCTEKYFKTRRTSNVDKMVVAAMAMRGEALKWWLLWSKCHPEVGWDDFTTHFLWQFKPEYREILPISNEEQTESQLKKDSEELVEEEKEQAIEVEPLIAQEDFIEEEPKGPVDEEEKEDSDSQPHPYSQLARSFHNTEEQYLNATFSNQGLDSLSMVKSPSNCSSPTFPLETSITSKIITTVQKSLETDPKLFDELSPFLAYNILIPIRGVSDLFSMNEFQVDWEPVKSHPPPKPPDNKFNPSLNQKWLAAKRFQALCENTLSMQNYGPMSGRNVSFSDLQHWVGCLTKSQKGRVFGTIASFFHVFRYTPSLSICYTSCPSICFTSLSHYPTPHALPQPLNTKCFPLAQSKPSIQRFPAILDFSTSDPFVFQLMSTTRVTLPTMPIMFSTRLLANYRCGSRLISICHHLLDNYLHMASYISLYVSEIAFHEPSTISHAHPHHHFDSIDINILLTSSKATYQRIQFDGLDYMLTERMVLAQKCGFSFSVELQFKQWNPGIQVLTSRRSLCSRLNKQWNPGGEFLTSIVIGYCSFKQWDPRKFVITSIFLQP